MPAAGRQSQRRARGCGDEPAFRIEHVEKRKEIELVRSSPVEEHERSLWLTVRGPNA